MARRRAAAILAGMTNPLEWVATSSPYGASSGPGRLTLTTVAAWATAPAAFVAIVALVIASYTIWSSNRALKRGRVAEVDRDAVATLNQRAQPSPCPGPR